MKRLDENAETLKPHNGLKRLIVSLAIVTPILTLTIILVYFMSFGVRNALTLEVGISNITLSDFYHHGKVKENARFLTDINAIDFTKAGDYQIEIQEGKKAKKVTLHLIDTTAPMVEFQDVYSNLDYEINPEDFIKSLQDYSNTTIKLEKNPEITTYQEYPVKVIVEDEYGNTTIGNCKLIIAMFNARVVKELGEKVTIQDILFEYDEAKDKNAIKESDLDKINKSGVGEYDLEVNLDNNIFKSKIIIKDTTAPTLTLKNVTIYDDEALPNKDSFIKEVKDLSGEVTTNLKTELKSEVGEYEVIIEATDKYGNTTEQKAKFTIKKDTEAPKFSGLSALTVNKNTTIDYKKGVKATDNKDGVVDFTVNFSSVNVSKYGTYYATYTATDKSGNKQTSKRKIVVLHDQSDTTAKLNQFASGVGTNYEEIRKYVSSKIKYNNNWGGDDPIWYGLINYAGNCYVHALIYQKLLEKAGYQVKLIWTTDKTHYWNLVYLNGIGWRHTDATPGNKHSMISAETDEVRLDHLQERDWDHSQWPEAK